MHAYCSTDAILALKRTWSHGTSTELNNWHHKEKKAKKDKNDSIGQILIIEMVKYLS